jgi:hypothetical protein
MLNINKNNKTICSGTQFWGSLIIFNNDISLLDNKTYF